jgi:hypothetical protein
VATKAKRFDDQRNLAIYDVTGATVQVLAIVAKSEADTWLARFANPA